MGPGERNGFHGCTIWFTGDQISLEFLSYLILKKVRKTSLSFWTFIMKLDENFMDKHSPLIILEDVSFLWKV